MHKHHVTHWHYKLSEHLKLSFMFRFLQAIDIQTKNAMSCKNRTNASMGRVFRYTHHLIELKMNFRCKYEILCPFCTVVMSHHQHKLCWWVSLWQCSRGQQALTKSYSPHDLRSVRISNKEVNLILQKWFNVPCN